jgi:hypothetical protein
MITTITIFVPLLGAIVMLLLPEEERPCATRPSG